MTITEIRNRINDYISNNKELPEKWNATIVNEINMFKNMWDDEIDDPQKALDWLTEFVIRNDNMYVLAWTWQSRGTDFPATVKARVFHSIEEARKFEQSERKDCDRFDCSFQSELYRAEFLSNGAYRLFSLYEKK